MSWRYAYPDTLIHRLDLMSGKPPLLAVIMRGAAAFHDLLNGTLVEERSWRDAPPAHDNGGDAWRTFAARLIAPSSVPIPVVVVRDATLFASLDGGIQWTQTDTTITLDAVGKTQPLEADADFAALAVDRALGLAAALDRDARLHIYQLHARVGVFDVGLTPTHSREAGARLRVEVANGGSSIFVSDGRTLAHVSGAGQVRRSRLLHYTVSALACSPDGTTLLLGDEDEGLLRAYRAADLTPTHQRYAGDVLSEARRVRAGGTIPTLTTVVTAAALNNRGVFAFAASGMVCVSALARLGALTG